MEIPLSFIPIIINRFEFLSLSNALLFVCLFFACISLYQHPRHPGAIVLPSCLLIFSITATGTVLFPPAQYSLLFEILRRDHPKRPGQNPVLSLNSNAITEFSEEEKI